MKKAIILMIVCVFVLAGCGGKSGNSKHEKLALDYMNNFVNATDLDVKKKFLEENIDPEVKPFFELGLNLEATEESKYENAKVLGSAKYDEEGMVNAGVVLISADGDKEAIVLINDDKIAFIFTPDAELTKQAFDEMKALIK